MKRNFITNLVFLLLVNLIIKPVYAFGIDIGVQNAVGPAEYGKYFILINFTIIFQILLDLGIENFSRREIARNHHFLDRYLSYILPLKLTLAFCYYFVCGIIGYLMGFHGADFTLLLILLFNQILANFILYMRANLGAMHLFRTDSILSITDKFLVIIICGIILIQSATKHNFRIEWFIYSQSVSYLIAAGMAFGFVRAQSGPLHLKFSRRIYHSVLKRSLPYALLSLLMAAYFRIDSVLLGRMLADGKVQAGIYAQSFRIVEIFSNYGYLFTLILLPVFSRLIKQGKPVGHLTRIAVTLLFVPSVILSCGCIIFRFEIIHTLYVNDINQSANAFGILTISFLGMCTTYIFGTLLTANGSLRQLNVMAAISVILNLALNLILIKRFGITGAAISSAVTQLFAAIYQIVAAKRIFHFKTDYKIITRLLVFVLLILPAGIIFKHLAFPWMYSFVIYLVFAGVLSIILQLIRLKSITEVVQNNE